MDTREITINQLTPQLKNKGYKKYRTTWVRENGEISLVFNLQKSQYSNDLWYYNFGIGFRQFFDRPITTISMCDIVYRLPKDGNEIPVSTVLSALDTWENHFGSIEKLRKQAWEHKIPPFISGRANAFLTSVPVPPEDG